MAGSGKGGCGGVSDRVHGGGLGLSEQKGMAGVFALGALCAMPEPVVTDFVKSPGEHVLEEATHETRVR